ncbi:MAG: hypothetical protein NC341_10055 [Blautia sp.]|nr:hypothetical protein [Blautia sp.]MCM1201972.1 hypothetical protein [Bacteroides fragilis]
MKCLKNDDAENKGLFFNRLFVSERKQIALMADERIAILQAVSEFLVASSQQVAQKGRLG